MIYKVGPTRAYPSIKAAIAKGADGMNIEVDRGMRVVDEVNHIPYSRVGIYGDWSDWNSLTSYTVTLRPMLSKVSKAGLLALGVTLEQITAVLGALPYKWPMATFTLPDGSTHSAAVGWSSPLLTQGIFTTHADKDGFHLEGLEIFDARTDDLTGSGVRCLGINNSVTRCKIHDCQAPILFNHQMVQGPNGLWKVVDGKAASVNMIGYDHTADNWLWNNGSMEAGGFDHQIYETPCAVQVNARNREWNCIGGHSEKMHGAVFQISLDQDSRDTDAGLTSQMLDADSGLIFWINPNCRKVDPSNAISNMTSMGFARNNRDGVPPEFGNFFMLRGGYLESTVHAPGSFVHILNSPTYKGDDAGALGVPLRFTFDIQRNVFVSINYTRINAKGQIVDDTSDYLAKPLNIPTTGGTVMDNYVGVIGGPTPDVARIGFGRVLFQDPANIIVDLHAFLEVLGQLVDRAAPFAYCQQAIILAEEDPVMISDVIALNNALQAQLATSTAQLSAATTTAKQLQAALDANAEEITAKDDVIAQRDEQLRASAATIAELQAKLATDEGKIEKAQGDLAG